MSQDDEYRAKAAEAQKSADRAVSPDDKARWLDLVAGWLGLIRKRPQSAEDNFRDELEAKGTKQQDSGSSH
jgi:hypothetical protein